MRTVLRRQNGHALPMRKRPITTPRLRLIVKALGITGTQFNHWTGMSPDEWCATTPQSTWHEADVRELLEDNAEALRAS